MADICSICQENRDEEDQLVSYDDCAGCGNPTCSHHGKSVRGGEAFYCQRCIAEYEDD